MMGKQISLVEALRYLPHQECHVAADRIEELEERLAVLELNAKNLVLAVENVEEFLNAGMYVNLLADKNVMKDALEKDDE